MSNTPLDMLAAELGAISGRIERETRLRIDAWIADVRAAEAERELRFERWERDAETRLAAVEKRFGDRLAELKDGIDGKDGADGKDGIDGKDGRDGIDGKDGADGRDGADGKDGRDGLDVSDITLTQDGDIVEMSFQVGEVRSVFEFSVPAGPAGEDGKDGEKGERGDPGADGKLTAVKKWMPGVHYDGDICAHDGATWQALKDTAEEPGGEDWICLAGRGADGKDGASFNPRRLWNAEENYSRLDVVALNGGSFVALKDDPGPCPGEGWMLIAQPGKRGEKGDRGEKGEKGDRGLAGAPVTGLTNDKEGVLTLTNGDGSKVQCDLYPLLSSISR